MFSGYFLFERVVSARGLVFFVPCFVPCGVGTKVDGVLLFFVPVFLLDVCGCEGF